MRPSREEFLAQASRSLDKQNERIVDIEACVDKMDGASADECRKTLVTILALNIEARNTLHDLRLVSQPGWDNAVCAAENTWHELDTALDHLSLRVS